MKLLTSLTDPEYHPPTGPSRLHRWLRGYVQDERDMPFVYLLLHLSGTMVPLAVLLFVPGLPGPAWWVVAGVYTLLGNLRFKGPFGLMLHCTTHRVLFKKRYGWLNHYVPWVIGPLFGQTPESYFTHHLGMHHPENNSPEDESSTMFYQRDSLVSFLHYLGDFLLLGVARLVGYFTRRHKTTLRRRLLRGELTYVVVTLGLGWLNLPATLVVLVLPLVIARVVMMLGNWTQHAFIAAHSPENCYTNSVTCINTPYNHACWNDGYHISHHLKPALHWTDHPAHFRANLAQYARYDAIVFDGIHFLHVFSYLMRQRYDLLARHFVELHDPHRTEEEVVALLRSRTQRLPRPVLVPA
ncbi:fatty acid desaturase [Hymenobacter tibetensis]|uniref:Fatty acid desaturase n=1 Tax=Hymenobacter tibetensis TaxID=497967 RepID=A0ABY4D069_9BACT|nr:fatty acid desaturase [Hymenobacter tibetensis]UOG73328.1 fatty acid desaturase [Hymenobacter tibetensis]